MSIGLFILYIRAGSVNKRFKFVKTEALKQQNSVRQSCSIAAATRTVFGYHLDPYHALSQNQWHLEGVLIEMYI